MKKLHQDLQWLKSIYENCESVGISKSVIQQFEDYYENQRSDKNEFVDRLSERA